MAARPWAGQRRMSGLEPTTPTKRIARDILTWVYVILFVAGGLSLWASIVTVAPDHASVLVDDRTRTYYAPFEEFVTGKSGLRWSTIGQARELNYSPDGKSRDAGAFTQSYSLFRYILDRVGIMQIRSRWNEDGSWNW